MIIRISKYFLYFIAVAIMTIIGIVCYFMFFQPKFNFPKPRGKFAVGTKAYHWIDHHRKETFYDNPDSDRELMVRAWYPAQGDMAEKPVMPYAPYLVNFLKKNRKLFWLFGGLSRSICTYSQSNLPLVKDKPCYPIIIFSHGAGGTSDSNTAHCEELASHGYVVVGISHTYDSIIVEFPDGHQKTLHETKGNNNFAERRKQIEKEIGIRINDVIFVLDKLELLAQDKKSIFYKKLDINNIGMFGQSFGGSTAVQMCRREKRIKAGVNLDGSLFGTNAMQELDKPFMFILAGNTVKLFDTPMSKKSWKTLNVKSPNEEKMLREQYILGIEKLSRSTRNNVYTIILKDAGHVDFTDFAILKHASPLAMPMIRLKLLSPLWHGKIDGFRATEIVNAYLVSFFNKYLKGMPSDLLDIKEKKYTEVRWY